MAAPAGLAGLLMCGTPLWIRQRGTAQLRDVCPARRTLVPMYDDGPGRELTPAVLDVLRPFDAPAARTCSAVSFGKSRSTSATSFPTGRFASTVRSVTRVPRKTGYPPQTWGSRTM